MKAEIEEVIKLLISKVTKDSKSHEDLQYTQAALNVAHTLATLEGIKQKS